MGVVRTTLQLRNPSMGNTLSPIDVNALVDIGAVPADLGARRPSQSKVFHASRVEQSAVEQLK